MRFVLIDIDDTLLDFAPSAHQAMQKAAAQMDVILPENILPVFLELNPILWSRIEDGTMDMEGLRQERWNRVFEQVGIRADGIAFEDAFRIYMNEVAVPVQGADRLLAYLSKKYTLVAAGNGLYRQQYSRLQKAGLLDYFQELFLSEKMGVNKPDPRFYQTILQEIHEEDPAQGCMIGDSFHADIVPTFRLGMKTIWLDRENKYDGQKEAEHCVHRLEEIMEIL